MIREIRNYIKEHGRISTQDLAVHFRMETTALEPILERLEKDGYIDIEIDEKCAGCVDSCVFAEKPIVMILWKENFL